MPEKTFMSYAQNREDVVLWRALRDVPEGRYVEVGANHPMNDSISRAFYDRGWSGVTVEPVPAFAELHRRDRPRDTLVEAAVTSADTDTVTLHVVGDTGLSTLVDAVGAEHAQAGWGVEEVTVRAAHLDTVLDETLHPDDTIHFMVVDVEGAERQVLESIDLRRWRPWVLVVEATAPSSTLSHRTAPRRTHDEWEQIVLDAGYEFCLFDGLSRFYVAHEKAAELADALSSPAGPLDFFTTHELESLRGEIDRLHDLRTDLLDQAVFWRTRALTQWSGALARAVDTPRDPGPTAEETAARAEVAAMRRTLSWRVTRPLRLVRRALGRVRRGLR